MKIAKSSLNSLIKSLLNEVSYEITAIESLVSDLAIGSQSQKSAAAKRLTQFIFDGQSVITKGSKTISGKKDIIKHIFMDTIPNSNVVKGTQGGANSVRQALFRQMVQNNPAAQPLLKAAIGGTSEGKDIVKNMGKSFYQTAKDIASQKATPKRSASPRARAPKNVINRKPSPRALSKVEQEFFKNPKFKNACENAVKKIGGLSDDAIKKSSKNLGAHYIDDVLKAGKTSFDMGIKRAIASSAGTRMAFTPVALGLSTTLAPTGVELLSFAFGWKATIALTIGSAVGAWLHNWLLGDTSSIIGSVKKSAMSRVGMTYGPSNYVNPLSSDGGFQSNAKRYNFPGLSPRDLDPVRRRELLALMFDAKTGKIVDPDQAVELFNLFKFGYVNRNDWKRYYKEQLDSDSYTELDITYSQSASDSSASVEEQEEKRVYDHYGYDYLKVGDEIFITKSPKTPDATEDNPIYVDPNRSVRFRKAYDSINKLFDDEYS